MYIADDIFSSSNNSFLKEIADFEQYCRTNSDDIFGPANNPYIQERVEFEKMLLNELRGCDDELSVMLNKDYIARLEAEIARYTVTK